VLQKIAAADADSQNNPGDGYRTKYTEIGSVQIIPAG